MEPDPLLDSLRNAVTAMPDDVPLRLHLATMLLRAGQREQVREILASLRDGRFDRARASALAFAETLTAPGDPDGDNTEIIAHRFAGSVTDFADALSQWLELGARDQPAGAEEHQPRFVLGRIHHPGRCEPPFVDSCDRARTTHLTLRFHPRVPSTANRSARQPSASAFVPWALDG